MANAQDSLNRIAARVSDAVKGLPRDELPRNGEERQFTVTIGGDNHGNITYGDHIVVNEHPPSYGDLVHDAVDGNLYKERKALVKYRNKAFVRQFLNGPNFGFFAVLLCLAVFALIQLASFMHHVEPVFPPMLALAIGACGLLLFGFPAIKKRKLEQDIIDTSNVKIEIIDKELHKRKHR